MQFRLILPLLILILAMPVVAEESEGKRVMISKDRYSILVKHDGEEVVIQRNQDRGRQIDEAFRSTTRGKIQPMHPFAPRAVETLGELEVLDYLEQSVNDDSILLIDARSAKSARRGTIPGSVNLHWKSFASKQQMAHYFQNLFNVTNTEGVWNFDHAKTLILYCNGPWCGQSSAAIKKLLRAGYPAHQLKYYRGGLQNWRAFGLTVVVPE